VRDDHHRRVAGVDHAFQPADRIDVEVVGRLVEQQDVRVGEQRLRQQHAQLPARRHRAHRAVVLLGRYPQAQQQLAGACLRRVSAQFGEVRLQVCRPDVILLAGVRVRVYAVALVFGFPKFRVPHQHDVEHPLLFEFELVLAELAQALALVNGDVAVGRLEIAAQDFHQRRLAAAIGADQAIAVAVAKFDRHVFEERLGAELDCEICSGEHGVEICVFVTEAACSRAKARHGEAIQ